VKKRKNRTLISTREKVNYLELITPTAATEKKRDHRLGKNTRRGVKKAGRTWEKLDSIGIVQWEGEISITPVHHAGEIFGKTSNGRKSTSGKVWVCAKTATQPHASPGEKPRIKGKN